MDKLTFHACKSTIIFPFPAIFIAYFCQLWKILIPLPHDLARPACGEAAKRELTMSKITQENFEQTYVDDVELKQIDMFVCREMERLVCRYIKGMNGSRAMLDLVRGKLDGLGEAEKEEFLAHYIDLNRRVVDGIDWKIVLTRGIANYCENFDYFIKIVTDKQRWAKYLAHIKATYLQFHQVYEQDGKFGIKSARGDVLVPAKYDFVRTPYTYVDDLRHLPVIAQLDGKMGLVLANGQNTIVAPFIYDDIALRSEPPFFEVEKDGKKQLMNYKGELCGATE